jgi:hypothetical protein
MESVAREICDESSIERLSKAQQAAWVSPTDA